MLLGKLIFELQLSKVSLLMVISSTWCRESGQDMYHVLLTLRLVEELEAIAPYISGDRRKLNQNKKKKVC